MFTIVASSTTMSWAMPTMPRISHRRLSRAMLAWRGDTPGTPRGAELARVGGPGAWPAAPLLVPVLFIALTYLEILRSLVMYRCFRLDGPPSSCAGTHFCLVSGDAAGRRPTTRGVAGNSYHGRMRSPARRVRSENGPG